MSTSGTRVLLLALIAIGVTVGVLAVRYVAGQLDQGDQVTVQPDRGDTAAAKLYLAGRDEFSICVDAAGEASVTDAQVDAVRTALELALRRALEIASDRLSEIPSEYASPVFVRGCPDAAVLAAAQAGEQLDRRERNSMRRDQLIGDLGPSAPSPHRAFVYFVDAGTYSAAFGADPYISTSEEFVCEGICAAVTRALYVPVGAQNDVIQDGLLEVLNLLTAQQIRDLWQDRLDMSTPFPTE